MHDYLAITEKILNMTRSMLESSRALEWEKLQLQQQQRQIMLKQLNVGRELPGDNKLEIAANLKEAAMLNERIVDLGMNAKTELAKMIGELQRGRKASRAYDSVG